MPGLLTTAPLLQTEIQERLGGLLCDLQTYGRQQVGYPTNQAFDYSSSCPSWDTPQQRRRPLSPQQLLENTHAIEPDAVARSPALMRIDPGDAWGYETSGGTEGN